MEALMDFINKYFLIPMGHYYTWPATLAYAAILIIAVFLVYKYILKKFNFKIDNKFIYALLPFILIGGIMRSLEDAEFYSGYLFVSPGIYFTVFAITLSTLVFSVLLEKQFKKPYWKFMIPIGSAILAYNIAQVLLIGIVNWTGFLMVMGLMLIWAIIFLPITKFLPKYLSKTNYFILLSQLLDGSATFIAITYFSYTEQHVFPNFLADIFGTWILFPLIKIAIVWPLLYATDKFMKEKDMREFAIWLKIIIIILGLALGTRDLLRMAMMV